MKRLLRGLAWGLVLASLFAIFGVVRVPDRFVGVREAGNERAALGAGLHLALRGWHTVRVAPEAGLMTLGAEGTAPLRFVTRDGHAVAAMVVVGYERSRPGAEDTLARRLGEALGAVALADLVVARKRAALLEGLPAQLSDGLITVYRVALGPMQLDAKGAQAADGRARQALAKVIAEAQAAAEAAEAGAAEAEGAAAQATRAAEKAVHAEEASLRAAAAAAAETLRGEAASYAIGVGVATDAAVRRLHAESDLRLAEATADVDRRVAAALAGPGGKWLIALEAIERFEPGQLDADTMRRVGRIADWKAWFTSGLNPGLPPAPPPERKAKPE